MMKWKVVKNPRSASADRSLECLKNDIQFQPNGANDANNNVGEDANQENNNNLPLKDTNKQRDSSLIRKPSVVATDCINLRSFLGLSRQRSETNLSRLGLIGIEPRRSQSEVRGVSCDRLTVGYHTAPSIPLENGKTRSSSPLSKSGCWMRGRKRERESRKDVQNITTDAFGKTIVTGSNSKRTSSKTRNGDCRTIADSCDRKHNKLCSTKASLKGKSNKRGSEDDIIEEDMIYAEIEQNNGQQKLLDANKDTFKEPKKFIRKKGLAPKPHVKPALFKETDEMEVNLDPNGFRKSGSPNSLNEMSQSPAARKPQRRNQTYSGRNQDKKSENRMLHSVKLNNLKNNEIALMKNKNDVNTQSVVAVAEVHNGIEPDSSIEKNKINFECESVNNNEMNNVDNTLFNNKETSNELVRMEIEKEDPPPYHIDTPDYSTLDSVNCSYISAEEVQTFSKEDVVNCNTDCDESIQETLSVVTAENAKAMREISLSGILRDSSNETKGLDSEPKKTVRFEKLDLIEKYRKSKSESLMDTEDDTDVSVCESRPHLKNVLDINSNEISSSDAQSLEEEDLSQYSDKPLIDSPTETSTPKSMTVNVLVRNPSPLPHVHLITPKEEPQTQFVVKKSFVITVAKQEKGFRSLCANRKSEVVSEQTKSDQQISVTFLCSGPPSEGWELQNPDSHVRLRSISVPPRSLQLPPSEVVTPLPPAIRGRSKERRSKERQHCRKNHKTKKKEASFVMPKAVIDELSQVLEKRKPSLDELSTVRPLKA